MYSLLRVHVFLGQNSSYVIQVEALLLYGRWRSRQFASFLNTFDPLGLNFTVTELNSQACCP